MKDENVVFCQYGWLSPSFMKEIKVTYTHTLFIVFLFVKLETIKEIKQSHVLLAFIAW